MFNAIPISVFFVSKIEAVTTTGVFQRCGSIDEENGFINVMFSRSSAKNA
jgi:hypothetical protein